MHLLAHHKEKTGDLEGAIATIDAAIAIEPIIECRLARASFLKRAGDHAGAAAEADVARAADLADRFLNGVCAKRQLQAGDHAGAEKTAAMFARDGDAASNLYEMQCSWFENEAGDCHRRAGNVARSLKYYVSVTKHYDDMEEDQFDFHGYCMRKMTLRMYVDMLRAEDSLYDRPAFRRAAKGAIETYARLHDEPYASAEAKEEEMLAKMTKEERQKYRKKQKQAAERAEREAAERKAAEEAAAKDGKKKPGLPKKPDPDPLGETLAATKTPLDDAARIWLCWKNTPPRARTRTSWRSVYAARDASWTRCAPWNPRRASRKRFVSGAARRRRRRRADRRRRDSRLPRRTATSWRRESAGAGSWEDGVRRIDARRRRGRRRSVRRGGGGESRRGGRRRERRRGEKTRSSTSSAKECIAAAETFEAIDEAAAAAFRARARVAFPQVRRVRADERRASRQVRVGVDAKTRRCRFPRGCENRRSEIVRLCHYRRVRRVRVEPRRVLALVIRARASRRLASAPS